MHLSQAMRKHVLCHMRTTNRSACASAQSDQRLCCSLPRQNDTFGLHIHNFKILAGLYSWAGQFVSCLVGDSWRRIFSWRGSFVFSERQMTGLATATRPLVITSASCCRTSQNLEFRQVNYQFHQSIWHIWWCRTNDSFKNIQALQGFFCLYMRVRWKDLFPLQKSMYFSQLWWKNFQFERDISQIR